MKIAVLGSGLMGKEVVRDLVLSDQVKEIGLADINVEQAKQVVITLRSSKIKVCSLDVRNEDELKKLITDYDVVINALFYIFNEAVVKAAIEVGVHVVDLGGHIGHVTEKILTYDEKAKNANVCVIPDLGVAPGMINILAGYGVTKLDQAKSVKMYVGGIPLKPEPPLEYNHVFSMEGVLDHYTEPSLVIRNGCKMEIKSLSEVERVYFDRFGPLEAFHTAGGTSTLSFSYPDLNELEYKTIRYPGHAEKFKLLVDLNLTKQDFEVDMKGIKLRPRDLLLTILDPIVALKEKEDVVLLRVIVTGQKNNTKTSYQYEMITYKDLTNHVTAMARVTASTISVVAQMIGKGQIKKVGVFPPEKIVPGDIYMDELKNRGIIIHESKIT